MDTIKNEINKIEKIINAAVLIQEVKKEALSISKGRRVKVIGSEFSSIDNPSLYDVVIEHKAGDEFNDKITRRLANKNISIEKIEGMTTNVLGVRRMRSK